MPADALPRSRALSPSKGKKKEETIVEHPLFDGAPRMPPFDGTLTRPNLRRQLRGGSFHDASAILATSVSSGLHPRSFSESGGSGPDEWNSTSGVSSSTTTPPESSSHEDMKEVLVYEVQPTDSVAGVALKYGIKVAALRKANKLWPSDSIHLRKVLYIPVGWQKRLKTIPISGADENIGSHAIAAAAVRESQTTQRVPASEFSFFPSRPSLFSEAEPILPPSPTSDSSVFPIFSRQAVPSVIDVFSNGIDAIARMSTESLSSVGRTSASEDLASSVGVELDVARATWRNTPTSATLPSPSLLAPRAVASTPFGSQGDNQNTNGHYGVITNIQPRGKPPMTVPVSSEKRYSRGAQLGSPRTF